MTLVCISKKSTAQKHEDDKRCIIVLDLGLMFVTKLYVTVLLCQRYQRKYSQMDLLKIITLSLATFCYVGYLYVGLTAVKHSENHKLKGVVPVIVGWLMWIVAEILELPRVSGWVLSVWHLRISPNFSFALACCGGILAIYGVIVANYYKTKGLT
jgi:hypothetical protein